MVVVYEPCNLEKPAKRALWLCVFLCIDTEACKNLVNLNAGRKFLASFDMDTQQIVEKGAFARADS